MFIHTAKCISSEQEDANYFLLGHIKFILSREVCVSAPKPDFIEKTTSLMIKTGLTNRYQYAVAAFLCPSDIIISKTYFNIVAQKLKMLDENAPSDHCL